MSKNILSGMDLKERPNSPDPTIRSMRNSLLAYIGSETFQPGQSFSQEYLDKLLGGTEP